MLEAGAYKIEVDRLMRYSGWHLLGTARMGDDPRDLASSTAGTAPTTCPTCTSSTARASSPRRRQPDVARSCALALRAADHMVETRFEQQVPA